MPIKCSGHVSRGSHHGVVSSRLPVVCSLILVFCITWMPRKNKKSHFFWKELMYLQSRSNLCEGRAAFLNGPIGPTLWSPHHLKRFHPGVVARQPGWRGIHRRYRWQSDNRPSRTHCDAIPPKQHILTTTRSNGSFTTLWSKRDQFEFKNFHLRCFSFDYFHLQTNRRDLSAVSMFYKYMWCSSIYHVWGVAVYSTLSNFFVLVLSFLNHHPLVCSPTGSLVVDIYSVRDCGGISNKRRVPLGHGKW